MPEGGVFGCLERGGEKRSELLDPFGVLDGRVSESSESCERWGCEKLSFY